MEEVLDRLPNEEPQRYRSIFREVVPLLNIQMTEMGEKMVRLSREDGLLAAGLPRDDVPGAESGGSRSNDTSWPSTLLMRAWRQMPSVGHKHKAARAPADGG
jgi:hypothetical protein